MTRKAWTANGVSATVGVVLISADQGSSVTRESREAERERENTPGERNRGRERELKLKTETTTRRTEEAHLVSSACIGHA